MSAFGIRSCIHHSRMWLFESGLPRNAKGSHISGMYMERNALMGTNLMKRHMSNMLTDEDIHILKIPMPTIMESTGARSPSG